MRRLLVALLLVLPAAVRADDTPDLGKILRLIGRFGMAHACPISADMALTNAHVIDLRPFDATVPMFGARYESVDERVRGIVGPLHVSQHSDLGIVEVGGEVGFYQIATAAPAPGERVWWMSYDWRNRKEMGAVRTLSGRVVRVIAGNIFIDTETPEGASGSCLLNSRGEALGVIAWGRPAESGNEATIAVGVWGDWMKPVEELRKDLGLVPEPEITVIDLTPPKNGEEQP